MGPSSKVFSHPPISIREMLSTPRGAASNSEVHIDAAIVRRVVSVAKRLAFPHNCFRTLFLGLVVFRDISSRKPPKRKAKCSQAVAVSLLALGIDENMAKHHLSPDHSSVAWRFGLMWSGASFVDATCPGIFSPERPRLVLPDNLGLRQLVGERGVQPQPTT